MWLCHTLIVCPHGIPSVYSTLCLDSLFCLKLQDSWVLIFCVLNRNLCKLEHRDSFLLEPLVRNFQCHVIVVECIYHNLV